jgi:hypothetical protein
MKYIVFKWRLVVRKMLTALMAAFPFLFGACAWGAVEYGPGPSPPEYGMPPQESISINGTVTYDNKPVPGFWVSVLNEYGPNLYTFTERDGTFELYITRTGSGPYAVFFQDIDGHLNGQFKSQTHQWTSGGGPMHIELEPIE